MKPPPVDLRVDAEGRWFADGQEVTNKKIYKLFCDSLVREEGVYRIRIDYMENPVTVDDAPFSIRRIYVENTAEGKDIVWLTLNDGRSVELDPKTLRAPVDDAVYCVVRDGRDLEARFSRTAVNQLGAMLEFDKESDSYFLRLNNESFELKVAD